MITQDSPKVFLGGESDANRIYPAVSPKAQKRWGGTIGSLFQAVVKAETNYTLKQVPSRRLLYMRPDSAEGLHECNLKYPDFMATGQHEGNQKNEFYQ